MNELILSTFGGALLGLVCVGYLFFHGKIVGISGMIANHISTPAKWLKSSAFWFLLGLTIMPLLYIQFFDFQAEITATPIMLILAGLLVGFGTRMASGCTSGHGICGLSRLSIRSLVATLCFMGSGFFTVLIIRHLLGA